MKFTLSSLISSVSVIVVTCGVAYGIYFAQQKTVPTPPDPQKVTEKRIAEDTTPPEAPQQIFIRRRAPTSIEFTWSDANDNVDVVGYDVLKDGIPIAQNISNTKYVAANLDVSTPYTFAVLARDAHGNVSNPTSITTKTLARNATPIVVRNDYPTTNQLYSNYVPLYVPVQNTPPPAPAATNTPPPGPDTTKPVVSGLSATSINTTGATIVWNTDEPATSLVDYGKDSRYGSSTPYNSSRSTSHSMILSGLTANTRYFYRVQSEDAAGNLTLSNGTFFDTSSVADTSAPLITNVSSNSITSNSANITWNTDEVANSQIEFGQTSSYGTIWTPSTAQVFNHSGNLTNLSADTVYHFRVKSSDAAGNTAISPDFSFRTLVASSNSNTDTTGPVISNFAVGSITPTQVTVTWTTNEDSDSQVQYGTNTSYGSASSVNSTLVKVHSVNITGLTANTTYHYRIKTKDGAGNLTTGDDQTFTTAQSDITPPVISSVSAGSITSISATISWTTGEPSDSQVEYGADTSYGSKTTLNTTLGPTHTVTLNGLSPDTTYHYRALSKDNAGNLATGDDMTFKTLPAPARLTNITISHTSDSITIQWTTPTLSDTNTRYNEQGGQVQTYNDAGLGTDHYAEIHSLKANTSYYVEFYSVDESGQSSVVENRTVQTDP